MKKIYLLFLLFLQLNSIADTGYVATCKPKNLKDWTGRVNNLNQKTSDELLVGKQYKRRGWVKFDLSNIPDNAIIKQVDIQFYVNEASADPSLFELVISSLYIDPVTSSASSIWDKIDNLPDYIQGASWGDIAGLKTYSNITTMNEDVQASISQGWFALGFYEKNEDADDCKIDGYSGNTPQLIVHYTLEPELCPISDVKDFGDVGLGTNPTNPSFPLTIKNCGGGTLSGNIVSQEDWLKVSSSSFNLDEDHSKTFTLTATTSSLATGDFTGYLKITSNGGNATHPAAKVSIKNTTGKLQIQVKNANWNLQPNAKVILYRNGSGSWQSLNDDKFTNSSGETSYWELPSGKYNAEVWYDGGGGIEFWTSAWSNDGAIPLNAGEAKIYQLQRNEPYAYDYKVFDDNTGENITGKEVPIGTSVTHKIYVTNKSSVDRNINVKMCLNKDRSTNWNYAQNSIVLPSNSSLSFDFKQTVSESGSYFRKIKVETLVHTYSQTDWWDWETSIIGKEKINAEVSINPISSVVLGNQLIVYCVVTNTGSSPRIFGIGAEIKDGDSKLKIFDSRTTSTIIAPGKSETVPYYFTIPDDWTAKDYTFHAAVWSGIVGVDGWLAEANQTFTVQSADAAQIIEFIVPTGTVQRESTQQVKVKIKNTGTTTRSFWVGLSFAYYTATNDSWPENWYDVYPLKSNELKPLEEQEITFLITIPINMRMGQYYAVASIWEGFDFESNLMSGRRYDSSLWYDKWADSDLGIKSYFLNDITFSTKKIDFLNQFSYILESIETESLLFAYNSGKKPLLYISPGVEFKFPSPVSGITVTVEKGGGIFFDIADMLGITPEGKKGWVTAWITSTMSSGISFSKPGVERKLNFGIVYHNFGEGNYGAADEKHDIFTIGKFSGICDNLSLISFDKNRNKWSGPKYDIGFNYHSNLKTGIKVANGSKIVGKFEFNISVVKPALMLNSLMGQTIVLNSQEYANNVVEELSKIQSVNDVYRDFTYDDGDIPIYSGQVVRNINLSSPYLFRANRFVLDIPDNVKKLIIEAIGGTGEARLSYKFGQRSNYSSNGSFDDDLSERHLNGGNSTIVIDNPQKGKHFIAIFNTYESYSNISLVANYETSESTKFLTTNPNNSWDYGNVTIGNPQEKVFLLQNTGSAALHVSDIKINGSNWDQFTIVSPVNLAFDVLPGNPIEVKVSFHPNSSGSKSAALSITNDSENTPFKTITLNGVGIPVPGATLIASKGTYADHIMVTWTEISGAIGYNLYRNISNNTSTAVSIRENLTAINSINDYDVKAETYYYWVKAKFNDGGSSIFSDFSNSDKGWCKGIEEKTIKVDQHLISLESYMNSANTFSITSNTNWTITKDKSWLSVSSMSGSKNATITLKANSANSSTSNRSCNLLIRISDDKFESITVTQIGSERLIVSPHSQTVNSSSGNISFSVTSIVEWSAEIYDDWLTATRTNENTISVSYLQNTTINSRTAEITVSSTGNLPFVVKVIQSPHTENHLPIFSNNTQPPNNAIVDLGQIKMLWECSDPDGEPLTFDLLAREKGDVGWEVITNLAQPYFDAILESAGDTIEWKVIASDNRSKVESPIWTFVADKNTSVVDYARISNVKIYPNPTAGLIKINGLMDNKETLLSVYDLLGQLVIQKISTSVNSEIDISQQKPGIYLLVINNDRTQTLKIIKE